MEGGVRATPIENPTLHATFLLWDRDDLVVTTMNWSSKQADPSKLLDEVGLFILAPAAVNALRHLLEEHFGATAPHQSESKSPFATQHPKGGEQNLRAAWGLGAERVGSRRSRRLPTDDHAEKMDRAAPR